MFLYNVKYAIINVFLWKKYHVLLKVHFKFNYNAQAVDSSALKIAFVLIP